MKKEKKYTDAELADAYIFPGELSPKEVKEADAEFSKHIKKMREEMTPAQHLLSKLMQLKFLMEDYVDRKYSDKEYTFGFFLDQYISKSHKTPDAIALETNFKTTQIISFLEDRKIPDEKFLVRLSIHSNELIPFLTWWRVLEKQKEKEIVADEQKLRKSESKFVKKLDLEIA